MNILLLGGIGSGKSLALEILRDKYCANIIEADKVAHFLYEKGQRGYSALVKLFGENILDNEKNIGNHTFSNFVTNGYQPVDRQRRETSVGRQPQTSPLGIRKCFTQEEKQCRGQLLYRSDTLPQPRLRKGYPVSEISCQKQLQNQ